MNGGQGITLATVGGGALGELFERERRKVLEGGRRIGAGDLVMGGALSFPCATPGCAGVAEYRGRCRACSLVRERARSLEAGRKFYTSARWRKLRAIVLARSPLCVACSRAGRVTAATEVHHTKPHNGVPAVFFDLSILEALCKPCHSRETAGDVWG